MRMTGGAVAEPDLGFVGVLIPVGFAQRERDPRSVGRDGRRADALEIVEVVDGWRGGLRARRCDHGAHAEYCQRRECLGGLRVAHWDPRLLTAERVGEV